MRKRSKILAIALLTIATACCCALSSIFAFANTVPNSNLTTWGDAEAGDSQGLTAVTTEKFEGEKSFEFSGTKKIRIKISSDGTLYQVSLKVKAAVQGTTFSLKAIGTHKDVDDNYAYTNHGGTTVTLTEEWSDYTFTLAYRYNADEQIVYYSNDGINERYCFTFRIYDTPDEGEYRLCLMFEEKIDLEVLKQIAESYEWGGYIENENDS